MIISDLTFLEETNENIEGAGFARLISKRHYEAVAQMDVEVDVYEEAEVLAEGQPRSVGYYSRLSITARV